MTDSERTASLERMVEQKLRQLDLNFLPHPDVMGLHPDFLVTLPDGRLIVVEAKSSVDLPAALRQMDLFIHILDAVGGVIAVPDIITPADQPSQFIKVVRISDLPAALRTWAG